jgi:hypothetical protein
MPHMCGMEDLRSITALELTPPNSGAELRASYSPLIRRSPTRPGHNPRGSYDFPTTLPRGLPARLGERLPLRPAEDQRQDEP